MNTKNISLRNVLILAGLILISVAGCQSRSQEEIKERSATIIQVAPISIQTISNDLDFTGVVQPFEEAHIAPATPGRIDRILVDVGDQVSRGQLLVQMDRTQLFQAQVQLETLKADLNRLDTLLQMGAVTQQNFDQMKAQYDVAKANYDNLASHTEIRATIPGVITGRYNSAGELFTMTPGPAGKPAIVSIMQIRPVKITIGVSEIYFPRLKTGQTTQIVTDLFPGRVFEGKVHKIYPTIDRASGTFKVELLVDNADLSLRPGMFARVALNLGETQALLVPALSVLKQVGSNERYVFVVEDGISIRKTVQPGRNIGDMQEILSGLEPGETLVVSGQHNLIHQGKVEIVN